MPDPLESEKHLKREKLFHANMPHLADLVMRSVQEGRKSADFYVVCINVDDPAWTGLAHYLMPKRADHDNWAMIRALGLTPMANGVVRREGMRGFVSEVMPDLAGALQSDPPEGHFHALVFSEGGISMFWLKFDHLQRGEPSKTAN